MTTAIICGGRTFLDQNFADKILDTAKKTLGLTQIIEGGAAGADSLGAHWAHKKGIPVKTMKAEWNKYGKSAGYRRNVDMANEKPDYVIAFPGGKGTAHMVRIAEEKGIKVFLVRQKITEQQ